MTIALPKWYPQPEVYYPDSDGMPMAESDYQRKALTYAVEALDAHFADRPDVYVSGNIFVYYEEGNRKAVVSPDVLVVMDIEKHDRKSYFVWREGKAPDWILEVTSESTRAEDQGIKFGLYAFLGVQEYFQYDPTGDYLKPALVGFRLAGRQYAPIDPMIGPGSRISVTSAVLGLEVRLEAGRVAFYDPGTGTKLLTYFEAEQARRQAEQARARAEQAQQQAEQAQQQAEQAQQQAEQARHQAEQALLQSEQARARAERERDETQARLDLEAAGRAALEERLSRLAAELDRLKGAP